MWKTFGSIVLAFILVSAFAHFIMLPALERSVANATGIEVSR